MVFSSPIFLFFFLPLFLALYYLIPARTGARNLTALIGSLFFYAWGEPVYVLLLAASTILHYAVALAVAPESGAGRGRRRALLAATIVLDLLILIYFKYTNFLLAQLGPALATAGVPVPDVHVALLLGISFVTFHQISFLVDVYCGRAIPPRNYIDCALYIFLFPQLVAGPIVRYHDIGGQIRDRIHSLERIHSGFFIFSIGLAKKILIADSLGIIADKVFAIPADQVPLVYAWIGILAYTMQIYFDFSGYSEMAIGLGRMMGFEFPRNFNRPYTSRSVTEFWQRWHITLSNWMRLYLYIPLGGNRVAPLHAYANLWIVFVLSGFWHGASWTFIVWGCYYGLFLTLEKICENNGISFNIPGPVRHIATFLIVMVGWVFFRSPSLDYAIGFLGAMVGMNPPSAMVEPWGWVFTDRGLTVLVLAVLISTQSWDRLISSVRLGGQRTAAVLAALAADRRLTAGARFATTLLLLAGSAGGLVSAGYTPFLYFRF